MKRDSIILSVLVAVALAVGVAFFLFYDSEPADPGFVPADTRLIDQGRDEIPADARRATTTTESPASVRTFEVPKVTGAESKLPPSELGGIVGVVLDPAGKPRPEAVVALCIDVSDSLHMSLQGDTRAVATTDGDGKFTMKSIEVEDRYLVRVETEDFPPKFVPLVQLSRGERKEMRIQLDPGCALNGVVTDLEGNRIPDCDILVYDQQHRSQDPDFDVERVRRTDANGEYRFNNLNPGFKRVTARKPGFASETNLTVNVTREGAKEPVNFTLAKGEAINGLVIEKGTNTPIAGALINASPIRAGVGNTIAANYPAIKSGPDGRFEFIGLAPGAYKLRFFAKGYGRTGVQQNATTGDAEVTVELERNPVAKGRVVDADTGAPVPRFTMVLNRGEQLILSSFQMMQKFDDPEGKFEYVDLETTGDFFLVASAEGYADSPSEKLTPVPNSNIENLVIRMSRGAALTGRIVDAQGVGIAGAQVKLSPEMGAEGDAAMGFIRMFQNNMRTASKTAVTDAEGYYTAANVAAANYRITASQAAYAEAELSRTVTVGRSGEVRAPDLTLSKGGSVTGTVFDAEKKLAPNSKIQLTEKGGFGGKSYTAISDENGVYLIKNVRPGIYTVRVVEMKGEPAALDFSKLLLPGQQLEIVVGDGELLKQDVDG